MTIYTKVCDLCGVKEEGNLKQGERPAGINRRMFDIYIFRDMDVCKSCDTKIEHTRIKIREMERNILIEAFPSIKDELTRTFERENAIIPSSVEGTI